MQIRQFAWYKQSDLIDSELLFVPWEHYYSSVKPMILMDDSTQQELLQWAPKKPGHENVVRVVRKRSLSY